MVPPVQDPTLVEIVRTLIAGGESYDVELKSAWEFGPNGKTPRDLRAVAKDIGETLVAFANSDGGDLVVGVEDSGTITGVPWDGDKLLYLVQAPRHQVRDADLGARVFEVSVDGHRVLLFRVSDHPGAVVVTSDGRCLWRRGAPARSEPVPPVEVERRRRHRLGDTAYEAMPVAGATLDDIAIPEGILAGKPHLARLGDVETLLRYWNLTEGRNGSLVLRRAALLLFARDPLRWHANNRLRMRRVLGGGEGFGASLRTQEIDLPGPIARLIPAAIERLKADLSVEAKLTELFTTTLVLPAEAVEECIVNAAAHRNYAVEGAAIEVLLYPEQVEFRSPGKLPEPLTVEDLRAQQGAHRARNPIIMRVLRDLGWTRDQGEGMKRIFASMAQLELHEPELDQVADTFIVRLSTRSRYDQETKEWLSAYGPFGLLPSERRYVVALRKASRGRMSVDRLARRLGRSFDETKAALMELERKGIVWHGSKSRTFHLVAPLSVPHERALRLFRGAGIAVDPATVIDVLTLSALLGVGDERAAAQSAERLRESGILAPAGKHRWKLGPSLLEYAATRGTD